MTQPALFDPPTVAPFAVRPACHLCGALGPLTTQHPIVAPKPHLAALVELDRHMREMHPDTQPENGDT